VGEISEGDVWGSFGGNFPFFHRGCYCLRVMSSMDVLIRTKDYKSLLWFVTPWLTHTHTHTHIASEWLHTTSSTSRVNSTDNWPQSFATNTVKLHPTRSHDIKVNYHITTIIVAQISRSTSTVQNYSLW